MTVLAIICFSLAGLIVVRFLLPWAIFWISRAAGAGWCSGCNLYREAKDEK